MFKGEVDNIWRRYSARLGLKNEVVNLGEGQTPLVPSLGISSVLGEVRLYFKLESLNPTGSFKDRFVALELSSMVECRERICIATSSGNTGASLAAYAARHGIRCVIFVNEATPQSKLQQALAYGAKIYRVRQFGTSAEDTLATFELLRHLAEESGVRLVISAFRYSPYGMQGVKTLAYELIEQLDRLDHIFIPVGGGGLLTAVWQGFKDCLGVIEKIPRIHAVQPVGCPTVVEALVSGKNAIKTSSVRTMISGLAVPCDVDGTLALAAVRESGGSGILVTDEEIWEAQACLCRQEGIYAEPAGAAALAGFLCAFRSGLIRQDEISVCLVTGHGFKDATSIERINADISVETIAREKIADLILSHRDGW